MKTIGIIGAGFCGTMVAVHLIRMTDAPFRLVIVDRQKNRVRGIAYGSYSDRHLLNVPCGKMSAFPDDPDHFLNWTLQQPDYQDIDRSLLAGAFVPRNVYGAYLKDLWHEARIAAQGKKIVLEEVDDQVVDLDKTVNGFALQLAGRPGVHADQCVLATGNHLPGDPRVANMSYASDERYFRNPWRKEAVEHADPSHPVLILGNGLTMVDTVLGLLEHHFKGRIIALSPNGFNILPHRHPGLQYSALSREISATTSLNELVGLFNRHIKQIRRLGISAEPLVDSVRHMSQQLWQQFSLEEKRKFLARIRHLWGVARHRIPLHLHDKLQQLRIDGQLTTLAGRITDINPTDEHLLVRFWDVRAGQSKTLEVSRIINCTGPQTDIDKMEQGVLKNAQTKGLITQDDLKLGIEACPTTLNVLDSEGQPVPDLFTLGNNLKGLFWESTAVNELRSQAKNLAQHLLRVM